MFLPVHPIAQLAIKAAKHRKQWGEHATLRFFIKRAGEAYKRLYEIACSLEEGLNHV